MKLNNFERTFPAMLAPADDPPAAPADPAPADPPAEPDFSFVGDDYRSDDGVNWEGFASHYHDLSADAARRAEEQAEIPESPDGYELALPEDMDFGDLELPEDFSLALKTDDEMLAPVFDEMRGLMHELGARPEHVQKAMGLIAKYEAANFSRAFASVNAEQKAMGPGAEARIASVKRSLESKLPAEMAEAVMGLTANANALRGLEKLLMPRQASTPITQPQKGNLEGLSGFDLLRAARETA